MSDTLTYSARSECIKDLTLFMETARADGIKLSAVVLNPDKQFPDVDFQFSTTASLDKLNLILKECVDCHTIFETLKPVPLKDNDLERSYAKMGDTGFIIQLFNVPRNLSRKTLTIRHDHIESWELMDIVTADEVSTANITIHTSKLLHLADLEGNIAISSSLYEVKAIDINIVNW